MDIRIRAKRDAIAQQRIDAAAKAIAAQLGIPLPEGVGKRHRGDTAVRAMKQREAVADLLEAVAAVAVALPEAPGLVEAIEAASDEELLALPGIGTRTVEALRGDPGE